MQNIDVRRRKQPSTRGQLNGSLRADSEEDKNEREAPFRVCATTTISVFSVHPNVGTVFDWLHESAIILALFECFFLRATYLKWRQMSKNSALEYEWNNDNFREGIKYVLQTLLIFLLLTVESARRLFNGC